MDQASRIVLAQIVLDLSTELADLGQAIIEGHASAKSAGKVIEEMAPRLLGAMTTLRAIEEGAL